MRTDRSPGIVRSPRVRRRPRNFTGANGGGCEGSMRRLVAALCFGKSGTPLGVTIYSSRACTCREPRIMSRRDSDQVVQDGQASAPGGNAAQPAGWGGSATVTISIAPLQSRWTPPHPASAGRPIAGGCRRPGTRTRRGTRARTQSPREQRRAGRPHRTRLL